MRSAPAAAARASARGPGQRVRARERSGDKGAGGRPQQPDGARSPSGDRGRRQFRTARSLTASTGKPAATASPRVRRQLGTATPTATHRPDRARPGQPAPGLGRPPARRWSGRSATLAPATTGAAWAPRHDRPPGWPRRLVVVVQRATGDDDGGPPTAEGDDEVHGAPRGRTRHGGDVPQRPTRRSPHLRRGSRCRGS